MFRNKEVAHSNIYTAIDTDPTSKFTITEGDEYSVLYILKDGEITSQSLSNEGRWVAVDIVYEDTVLYNETNPFVTIELDIHGKVGTNDEISKVKLISNEPSEYFISLDKKDSSELFTLPALGIDWYESLYYEIPHDAFKG